MSLDESAVDEEISKLSSGFLDRISACYLLDSIYYSGTSIKKEPERVLDDVRRIRDIALLYLGQEQEVLRFFDQVIGKAADNEDCCLFRHYIGKTELNPVKRIYSRLGAYKTEYKREIAFEDLKIIIEREILLDLGDKRSERKKVKKYARKWVVHSKKTKS